MTIFGSIIIGKEVHDQHAISGHQQGMKDVTEKMRYAFHSIKAACEVLQQECSTVHGIWLLFSWLCCNLFL